MTSRVSREFEEPNDQAEARLVSTLLSISKSTRALVGLKLSELGFHNGQDELLFALDERSEVSVSKIADELCVRASTVSKMLDRLVAAGMAERTQDKTDARRTMVRITADGLDARRKLRAMRERLETELIASLPGDPEITLEALDTTAANLKGRLRRIR